MKYYIEKQTDYSFEEAVQKITEELKKVGFGVLSEINIHEKFKDKLGVDFRKYRILGACNPAKAYEAMQAEDKIGVLLPCNVIVQELDNGKTEVAAVDPEASMQAVDNPKLSTLAKDIKTKLETAIHNL